MNKKTEAFKWKSCKENPPDIGQKVLAFHKGDIYVVVRYEDHYLPMPFFDHYHALNLCFPEMWMELDFPEGFNGKMRVAIDGEILDMPQYKCRHPEKYKELADSMIKGAGTLQRPKEIQRPETVFMLFTYEEVNFLLSSLDNHQASGHGEAEESSMKKLKVLRSKFVDL